MVWARFKARVRFKARASDMAAMFLRGGVRGECK